MSTPGMPSDPSLPPSSDPDADFRPALWVSAKELRDQGIYDPSFAELVGGVEPRDED